MPESNPKTPVNVSESTTVTIVGVSNMAPADSRALPTYEVTSFTVPSENTAPSHPLNEGAVRVGNSLLSARVPESAILRDKAEEF
jgi:hypothetical protein